jgi:hypothetical protein
VNLEELSLDESADGAQFRARLESRVDDLCDVFGLHSGDALQVAFGQFRATVPNETSAAIAQRIAAIPKPCIIAASISKELVSAVRRLGDPCVWIEDGPVRFEAELDGLMLVPISKIVHASRTASLPDIVITTPLERIVADGPEIRVGRLHRTVAPLEVPLGIRNALHLGVYQGGTVMIEAFDVRPFASGEPTALLDAMRHIADVIQIPADRAAAWLGVRAMRLASVERRELERYLADELSTAVRRHGARLEGGRRG